MGVDCAFNKFDISWDRNCLISLIHVSESFHNDVQFTNILLLTLIKLIVKLSIFWSFQFIPILYRFRLGKVTFPKKTIIRLNAYINTKLTYILKIEKAIREDRFKCFQLKVVKIRKPRDEPRAGLKRLRNNPCCDKLSIQI
jgi:hypothetical protein